MPCRVWLRVQGTRAALRCGRLPVAGRQGWPRGVLRLLVGSTWRRAHATCCLHLRMLHVLRVLHEWLVAPVMVLALMHCHQVCWRWAIHRVQDRARKWQTLHKDGVRTTVWPSWGHHHGLPRQLVPVLRWVGRAPVLLLWQRWAHPWHLVRVGAPPGPGVCLHHHVSGLQAGCLRHRHTTVQTHPPTMSSAAAARRSLAVHASREAKCSFTIP